MTSPADMSEESNSPNGLSFSDANLDRLKKALIILPTKSEFRNDITALLARLEAKESLCEAVGHYKKECENPIPDAIYKSNLRKRMFELYEAWRKKAGK